jgi:hypothetical protein
VTGEFYPIHPPWTLMGIAVFLFVLILFIGASD